MAMSVEDNKTVVQRVYEEVWNQLNLAALDELVSPEFTDSDPNGPRPADATKGPERMKQIVQDAMANYRESHWTIEDQLAEGDKVATRWVWEATRRNGKHVRVTGITINHTLDGKITGDWAEWDAIGYERQLGLRPADPTPTWQ
jgi:predicted ester cyclase